MTLLCSITHVTLDVMTLLCSITHVTLGVNVSLHLFCTRVNVEVSLAVGFFVGLFLFLFFLLSFAFVVVVFWYPVRSTLRPQDRYLL